MRAGSAELQLGMSRNPITFAQHNQQPAELEIGAPGKAHPPAELEIGAPGGSSSELELGAPDGGRHETHRAAHRHVGRRAS